MHKKDEFDYYIPQKKSSFKKKLSLLSLVGASMGTAFLGSRVIFNAFSNEENTEAISVQKADASDYQSLIVQTTDEKDRETLSQLIQWAEEIPSGRNVLEALKKNKTQLFMLNLVGNEYGVSFPDLSGVCLNSALLNKEENKYLTFAAFIHEAEHVRVMGLAHQNKIGLDSFQSLDDRYIYGTINEALAVRKSVQAIQELIQKHPDWPYAQQWQDLFHKDYGTDTEHISDLAFRKRMENLSGLGASYHYETHIPKINEQIIDQKKFPKNPDWNKIVKTITDNEVQKVPTFPVPSFQMARDMVWSEIVQQKCIHFNSGDRNYQPQIKDLDLSCVIKNKDLMFQNDNFCGSVWNEVAGLAKYIYHANKGNKFVENWLPTLTSLMPSEQIEKLKKSNPEIIPQWQNENMDVFLSKQDNFKYLKNAQKILASKELSSLPEESRYCIKNTQNFLKIYDELFFTKENQQIFSQKKSCFHR